MGTLPYNDRVTAGLVAAAGQVNFTADFPAIQVEGDYAGIGIRRIRAGAASELVLGADFEITAADDDGFTAVLVVPALLDDVLWIYGDLTPARTQALISGGAIYSEILEDDATSFQVQLQELARDRGRELRSPIGETLLELPAAADRALGVLIFDASGQVMVGALPEVAGLSAVITESGNTLIIGGSYVFATADEVLQAYLPPLDTVAASQSVEVCDGDDNAGTNPVTITASGADTIQFQQQAGAAFPLDVNSGRARFVSRGTYWRVIA